MTARSDRRPRALRLCEYRDPPSPATREVLVASPVEKDPLLPPVLMVPGIGHGAWAFAEHWLEYVAERGFTAHAMSLRGHGASQDVPHADLRSYVHDVVQVAVSLPRQAVIVGHGAGAAVVAMALSRYPARAGILVSPIFGGMGTVGALLRRNPFGTLVGACAARVNLRPKQLFSPELTQTSAREYADRIEDVSRTVLWELAKGCDPERPVGDPPILVVGSPDDKVVSRTALEKVAQRYGGAPLLFPGMGHNLLLDARWREPVRAICDWLEKLP